MGGLAGKVYNSSVGQIIKNSAAFRTYQRCSAISFLRTHNVSYSSSKKAVSRDMADMKICRNISFSEYFQFHFEEKDCHARDAYISNADRKRLTQGLNSNPALLSNKYKTYLEFSDFFYRDVCIYESESETDNVRDFLSAHNEFIAKPIGACKGQGVRKLCVTDSVDQALEELRSQYVGGGTP